MTTHLHGFICLHVVYEHKSWTWEDSMHSGPWPLRKDGEPRKRATGAVNYHPRRG